MRFLARGISILALAGLLTPAAASATAPTGSSAADRIAWEPGPPAVGFHHGQSLTTAAPPRALLVADLHGQALSFSPADTALFAVFLAGDQDLGALRDALRRSGAGGLVACAEGIVFASRTSSPVLDFSAERVEVGLNGTLKVRADEGRHPGRDRLAVINAAGEILSVRPLWRAASAQSDMAASRP